MVRNGPNSEGYWVVVRRGPNMVGLWLGGGQILRDSGQWLGRGQILRDSGLCPTIGRKQKKSLRGSLFEHNSFFHRDIYN